MKRTVACGLAGCKVVVTVKLKPGDVKVVCILHGRFASWPI